MNRLLQGDVGSGKTVIAAMAVAVMAFHKVQSALMAPTSILAEQHYQSMQKLLSQPVDNESEGNQSLLKPEEICLLIGSTPEPEKEKIRSGLLDGTVKLVIGTHALLEEPVSFANLQLAIIDEQHRFEFSSVHPASWGITHLLVATATPIPRSLALTIYGDLIYPF
jgi:ATP-dependent DNA helicase RecG